MLSKKMTKLKKKKGKATSKKKRLHREVHKN
jgi:hypothetical protein